MCQIQNKRDGCRFGDKCSFIHREDKTNQRKKQKKDSKPDKATTSLVKYTDKWGSISRRTEIVHDSTDGFTDVRRSILKKSNKKCSRNHLTTRFCRSAEKHSDQRAQRSVIDNCSEKTAIPMPLCMNRESQAGLSIAKDMQERQHGHLPRNVTKLAELTKRTRILFSDESEDLERPLDQVLLLKRHQIYCGFRGRLHARRARNQHVSKEPHHSYYGKWDDTHDRAGDRPREGSGHVRHCPTPQEVSTRITSWKSLQ